jgi:hypothetical protein
MILVAVLGILLAYLLLSVAIIWASATLARRLGGRARIWGGLAAIAMYHLVFWDLIPTFFLYPHYQSQQAGLWVYQSPESWSQENPDAIGKLPFRKIGESIALGNGVSVTLLNPRIRLVQRTTQFWPQIHKQENYLVDVSTSRILAKHVYFESGDCREPLYYRFWISHCGEATGWNADVFMNLWINYKTLGAHRDAGSR